MNIYSHRVVDIMLIFQFINPLHIKILNLNQDHQKQQIQLGLVIFKICNQMQKIDQDTIRRQLQKLDIPYDLKIVRESYLFLSKFIGPLCHEDAQYHIPAACAIICQIIKIPTVDNQNLTSTGIKIENVMRHIGNLSKQKFLDTIEIQIKKSDVPNHCLIQKVGNIRIAFRVFKKYKTIFENLSIQNKIPYQAKEYLLDFFWLIFLIAKQNLQALENLILSTKILVMVIEEVFTKYYGTASKAHIRNYISRRDNFTELPAIFQQQQSYIKSQIYDLVNNTIQSRNSSWTPNSNNLLENNGLLERLVNDLNYRYDKMYENLPEGRYIDESTFLQLTKNLTPQAFVPKSHQQPISKILSFDQDDDDNDDMFGNDDFDSKSDEKTQKKLKCFSDDPVNEPLSISLFKAYSFSQSTAPKNYATTEKEPKKTIVDFTPVSLGQTKAAWAHNFVSKYQSLIQPQMRKYFENKQILFDNLKKETENKISVLIDSLTKYVINKEKSKQQIQKMFFTFAFDLVSKKPSFNVAHPTNFDSLLCISTYVYNQTTRYSQLELQKYCVIYKVDILDCLKVVYEITDCQTLPDVIRNLLSALEKEVLIKQLWDNDRGYELLVEGKTFSNQVIFNRLNRRTHQRVMEICQASRVELVEVKKIEALIEEIFKRKPDIIRKNKLDQILICAICACLNLNQAKYNLALSTIFQKYHSLPLGLHSNQKIEGNDEEGAPKTLLEFYNKIFIHEVQDMMSRQESPKYLYTPIRENHLKKIKGLAEGSLGLKPSAGLVKKISGEGNSYRNKLIQKLRGPKEQQMGEQQQCDSPYFGRPSFKRKFTFGKDEQ